MAGKDTDDAGFLMLQEAAEVPVCWYSPEGPPLLICLGFTPLAFVPRTYPTRQQGDLESEFPSPSLFQEDRYKAAAGVISEFSFS